MNEITSASTRWVKTFRWTARIIGILAIAVFLVFFIADCIKKGTIAIESDRILMTVFMFLAFIGLIISWKREGIGGVVALIGMIGFNIFAPPSLAEAAIFLMTGLYGLPALLFVFCWWQTKKQLNPKTS